MGDDSIGRREARCTKRSADGCGSQADTGRRPGLVTDERQAEGSPERENPELSARADPAQGSAYFAQAGSTAERSDGGFIDACVPTAGSSRSARLPIAPATCPQPQGARTRSRGDRRRQRDDDWQRRFVASGTRTSGLWTAEGVEATETGRRPRRCALHDRRNMRQMGLSCVIRGKAFRRDHAAARRDRSTWSRNFTATRPINCGSD